MKEKKKGTTKETKLPKGQISKGHK